MPVRFVVAPHAATPVNAFKPLQKPQDCLDSTWGRRSKGACAELLQSSLQTPADWFPAQTFEVLVPAPTQADPATVVHDDNSTATQYLPSIPRQSAAWDLSQIIPRSNGFIDAVVQAYNKHHHLIIRPDDVWLAILGQFNLYVNSNAEALRSYFVAHEGKKELIVTAVGTRYNLKVNFGSLAKQMTTAIDKNVLDKGLKDWILPDFTTTTHNDTVISAVMMMSTLKAYFRYTMGLDCGIPSVTLEGEKEDWEKLLKRIDRLRLFGQETEAWSVMLQPILTRFIQAFDGNSGSDFWNHACHYKRMFSGSDILSGWITAFCVWDKHGRWRGSCSAADILMKAKERPDSGAHECPPPSIQTDSRNQKLDMDGIPYPSVSVVDIPPGYCEVDVSLDDNGEQFECMMVSGHMSVRVEGISSDVIRPHPAWFMFIKG